MKEQNEKSEELTSNDLLAELIGKKSAERLRNNTTPFGLVHYDRELTWGRAVNSGMKMQRFDSIGIFMEPIWVDEERPIDEWNFTDTFRCIS